MFSKEFIHTLANANAQDDLSMEHMATVLQVLWREVERLERSVVIKHNEITLKTGDASIVLKFDGSVVIRGNNITVESSGRTSIKASGDLVLKGSKIVTN
jgi:hypothetical protein